jgi:hypothetical protein
MVTPTGVVIYLAYKQLWPFFIGGPQLRHYGALRPALFLPYLTAQ